MKILISNDDGYKAEGINTLQEEIKKFYNSYIIAPHKERSSCGHGLTLGEPIRLTQVNEKTYSCSGLPADCILIGVGQVFKNDKPDLILSGINHGANLGQDRYYSGTMAAAREGVLRGIPSVSVSLVTKAVKDIEHYEVAAKFVRLFIQADLIQYIPEHGLVNINVPNIAFDKIAGVKITLPGDQNYTEEVIERTDARGKSYYWVGGTYQGHHPVKNSDCDAVSENYISVNLQDISGRAEIKKEDIIKFESKVMKEEWIEKLIN